MKLKELEGEVVVRTKGTNERYGIDNSHVGTEMLLVRVSENMAYFKIDNMKIILPLYKYDDGNWEESFFAKEGKMSFKNIGE